MGLDLAWQLLWLGLWAWLALEFAWLIASLALIRPLMQKATKPPAGPLEPEAAILKVLGACDVVGEPFTRFIEGWFQHEVRHISVAEI